MSLGFIFYEAAKSGVQRIMVKSSRVSSLPLLAECSVKYMSSVVLDNSVLRR